MLTLKLCFRSWIRWEQMLWRSNQINLPVHKNTNASKCSHAELSVWAFILQMKHPSLLNRTFGGRAFRNRSLWQLTNKINLNLRWEQKQMNWGWVYAPKLSLTETLTGHAPKPCCSRYALSMLLASWYGLAILFSTNDRKKWKLFNRNWRLNLVRTSIWKQESHGSAMLSNIVQHDGPNQDTTAHITLASL